MSALLELLKKSVLLALVVTTAVVILIIYQLITKNEVEHAILDMLVALLTYWAGVLTPQPPIVNGK